MHKTNHILSIRINKNLSIINNIDVFYLKSAIVFSFLLLFFNKTVNSQSSLSEINFGIKSHYGVIWAHSPKNKILVQGHFPVFEASIFGKTSGVKLWHQLYNKPQIGFSVIYTDLALKNMMGFCTGIYPWVNFNLKDNSKKYKLFFKVGAGIGYINKVFDLENNFKNTSISAKINALINFQIENQIQITPKISGNLSLSLFHYSNGSSRKPNLGVNIPTINIGLGYRIAKREISNIPALPEFNKNKHIVTTLSGGWKQPFFPRSATYPVINSSTTFEKQFRRKNAYSIGFDMIYDKSYVEDQQNTPTGHHRLFNTGITIGHILVVEKLNILTQWGVYTSSKALAKKSYHRIGLRYYLNKNVLICFALNTHFGSADHMEWGIGYKF
ncbi:MAG: acyloxyacyl hydrolase [Bacteroidota bacterium]